MHKPAATKRTVSGSTGPLAWCPSCQAFKPAAQVAWGQERRDSAGRITATYAAIPHNA